MRVRPVLVAAAAGGLLGLAPVAPPATFAADPICDVQGSVLESDADPLRQLGIDAELRELAGRPGTPPVRVAVLDSGVTGPAIPVVAREAVAGTGEVRYFHGTAVAGLIAGAGTGVAPDAEIVDVRVYDSGPGSSEPGVEVTSASIAAGLRWVAQEAERLNIRIANVSHVVPASAELEAAVDAVRKADVIVVASSGNRPQDGQLFDEDFADGGPGPGEDAARSMHPTGYGWPRVVSVAATAGGSGEPDPTTQVVLNSATTVAAPTFGARTYGLDGKRCALASIATSWAAAEVSGVLALLAQRFPDDTDEQLMARLVSTANGTPDEPTPLTGAGVVQPLEALTRPLAPDESGDLGRTVAAARDTAPAVAPEPDGDPLAGARDDALWWGLIGGGVLVVALLLRPVLARRRS